MNTPREGLIIGPLWIHRLEQWDLGCSPLLAMHWRMRGWSRRILCLWTWGVQLGPRGYGLFLTRRTLMIGPWAWRFV